MLRSIERSLVWLQMGLMSRITEISRCKPAIIVVFFFTFPRIHTPIDNKILIRNSDGIFPLLIISPRPNLGIIRCKNHRPDISGKLFIPYKLRRFQLPPFCIVSFQDNFNFLITRWWQYFEKKAEVTSAGSSSPLFCSLPGQPR